MIIQYVIDRFKGLDRFSELTGMNKNTARWWTYYSKQIPSKWLWTILEAAKKNEIELTAEELMSVRNKAKKRNA